MSVVVMIIHGGTFGERDGEPNQSAKTGGTSVIVLVVLLWYRVVEAGFMGGDNKGWTFFFLR